MDRAAEDARPAADGAGFIPLMRSPKRNRAVILRWYW